MAKLLPASALLAAIWLIVGGPAPPAAQAGSRGPAGEGPNPPPPSRPAAVDTLTWHTEVILEGGLVLPAGDLPASFAATDRGFAADPGYVLGLRLRWYPARAIVIAPGFQFAKYGILESRDAANEKIHLSTSARRFALDVLYQVPGSDRSLRPFIGAGAALSQNHYSEELIDAESRYEARVNALALLVHTGARLRSFEVTLSLSFCSFATPRFFYTGSDVRYRWDAAQLTVGYVLPKF